MAEPALQTTSRLGRILELAFDEIYIFDAASLRFLEVSRGALDNLGYTMAEMRAMTPLDLKPELSREKWRQLTAPLQSGARRLAVFQTLHRRKDGSVYPVEVRLQLAREETPPVYIAIIHDISERLAAEKKLQESERRFRAFVEQSPFGIQFLSPDGRTTHVNPAWERITGARLEDLSDYNILRDRQLEKKGIMPYVRRAFAGESVSTPPVVYAADDTPEVPLTGYSFCTRGHFYPIRNARGEIQEVVLMHEDVTEQFRIQQALEASEQRFHILAQVAPVGIFRTDEKGNCLYVNERWCAMAGITAEAASGDGWLQAIHPEDRERVFREWRESTATERAFTTECRFLRPDGTVTWLLAQAAAEYDDQGKVVGYVGSVTDITELKRIEQAIQHIASGVSARTGEAFFESLVIHLGKLFSADYAFVGLFEAPQRIRTIAVSDHGRIADNFIYELAGTPCAQVLDRKTCNYPHDVQRLFPDDELLRRLDIQSYMGTPLADPHGRPLGLIVILNHRAQEDTAWIQPILEIFAARTSAELERLRALAELERHRDSLEEIVRERTAEVRKQAMIIDRERTALAYANRELESFAYSVSHDLRAPLRAINGFGQALEEDYAALLDAEGRDYLRRIRAASQRMGQLIDDLLKLSRVSRHQLQFEEVDLSTMAREILAELRQGTPGRRVDVHIERGLTARGDAKLLRIVLENLLDNAWKYTRRKPEARIEFGAVAQDGETVFFVRDNGTGFDMRYVDKLFVAFQRLHHLHEYEGTGIGLATVARIINRHSGRVWAEGESGKGAVFYFSLHAEGRALALPGREPPS